MRMRHKLKNRNFVIIASNCIGGVLLHDLGMRFDTPTINLTIPKFISFVERYQYYLAIEPKYNEEKSVNYPVFDIDDIEINAIHYSKEEFLSSWNKRKTRFLKRIADGAEIIVFAADSQMREERAFERFSMLPYRKVAFSAKKREDNCVVYLPKYNNCDTVGDLTRYSDVFGRRVFERYFDCVDFLNR